MEDTPNFMRFVGPPVASTEKKNVWIKDVTWMRGRKTEKKLPHNQQKKRREADEKRSQEILSATFSHLTVNSDVSNHSRGTIIVASMRTWTSDRDNEIDRLNENRRHFFLSHKQRNFTSPATILSNVHSSHTCTLDRYIKHFLNYNKMRFYDDWSWWNPIRTNCTHWSTTH